MPPQYSPEVQKKLDDRERARTDKMFLATEVMGCDFQPDVHQELFDQCIKFDPTKPWTQQSDKFKRMILWSRGHYKSRMVQVEIIQAILNFPDIRILIMQGSIKITQILLHEIKSYFTGDNPKSRLPELFPEFCSLKLGNASSFTVPARKNKGLAQATVTVASPRGIKTGQHYDVGFFDDLVNDANYRSPRLLQKVKEDYQMCLPLLDPPFYAYVTGTRYAHGDLYEEIIRWSKNNEWIISIKDCWGDDGKSVRFPQRSTKDGRIVGFTREILLSMQKDEPEMFSSQYLNKPIQRGGQRFHKAMMEGALVAPQDMPPLSQSMFFVDLAAADTAAADDSVIVVGKTDLMGGQYVVDCRGGQWVPPVFAQNLIEMALIHRPVMIWLEKTNGSRYFADFVREICRRQNIYLPIDFLKTDNKEDAKAIRIGALEGRIKSKVLKFAVGLNRWDKIVEQFGIFPAGKSRHDDYPDTIALMSAQFTGTTNLQPVKHVPKNPILAMIAAQEQANAFAQSVAEQVQPDDEGEFRF